MRTILTLLTITLISFGAFAEPTITPSGPAPESSVQAASPAISLTSANIELAQGCCKVCSAGKACGNSCISRSKSCHQPRGCACDGVVDLSILGETQAVELPEVQSVTQKMDNLAQKRSTLTTVATRK